MEDRSDWPALVARVAPLLQAAVDASPGRAPVSVAGCPPLLVQMPQEGGRRAVWGRCSLTAVGGAGAAFLLRITSHDEAILMLSKGGAEQLPLLVRDRLCCVASCGLA